MTAPTTAPRRYRMGPTLPLVPQAPAGTGWKHRAACRGVDPELFFPVAESGPVHDEQVAAAKRVCARCPVRSECLRHALVLIPVGVVGGLTADERRGLRSRDGA